jgi:hypothetical protein
MKEEILRPIGKPLPPTVPQKDNPFPRKWTDGARGVQKRPDNWGSACSGGNFTLEKTAAPENTSIFRKEMRPVSVSTLIFKLKTCLLHVEWFLNVFGGMGISSEGGEVCRR